MQPFIAQSHNTHLSIYLSIARGSRSRLTCEEYLQRGFAVLLQQALHSLRDLRACRRETHGKHTRGELGDGRSEFMRVRLLT
jgi:hypothetical protein